MFHRLKHNLSNKEDSMKTITSSNGRRIRRVAALSLLLWIAPGSVLAAPESTSPVAQQISRKKVFAEPLIWVGSEQPSDTDSEALLEALDTVRPPRVQSGIAAVESFISTHANSPWIPSLHANLAAYHRETGRYSLALAHWQAAWSAVGSTSGENERRIGDFALASWLRLLASLGRQDEIRAILDQIGDRQLSRLDWQKNLVEVKQAVITMDRDPSVSFKCGTFSLYHVGQILQPTNSSLVSLLRIPSPASGFALSSLVEISKTNGFDMLAVRRPSGQEIVVPSVIHWRQNHYAAVLERRGDYYLVVDPTFGSSRWISADVVNEEATGYFLLKKESMPSDWIPLAQAEADTVYGRGGPNYDYGPPTPPCQTCPCPAGGFGPGGFGSGPGPGPCTSCGSENGGMPIWNVTEPDTSLALYDTPMFYQPGLGGEFALKLAYRQRESRSTDNTFPNFGPYWSGGWVDFVDVTPAGGVTDYSAYSATNFVGQGGGGWSYIAASGSSGTARDPRNGTKLESLWNSTSNLLDGFKLTEANGNQRTYKFIYTISLATGQVRAFLTEHIMLPGYTNRFVYALTNSVVQLRAAVDADGQTNTLYYENASFPVQITKVTNPFGKSVTLMYDGSGLLTNVVDVVNLTNSFAYDTIRIPGVPELVRMETAYGTTYFRFTGLAGGDLTGETGMGGVGRSVLVTESNRGKQLFIYRDDSSGSPLFLQSAEPNPPADFPGTSGLLGNTYMHLRNSFYWGPRQYDNLSTTNFASFTGNDYLLARRRNYLHLAAINPQTGVASLFQGANPTPLTYSPTLNMDQEPSPDGVNTGQRTWYGYFGKPLANVEGNNRLPALVAQVLQDGTVNYRYSEYWRVKSSCNRVQLEDIRICAALGADF